MQLISLKQKNVFSNTVGFLKNGVANWEQDPCCSMWILMNMKQITFMTLRVYAYVSVFLGRMLSSYQQGNRKSG